MAITVSVSKRTIFGDRKVTVADVTFGNSYPTGGESVDAGLFGMQTFDLVLITPAGGYMVEYDYTANKIKALTPTTAQAAHSHTENTAAAYAQNAVTATAGAITAAAGNEVAAATNLSTLKVRVMAIGN